MRVSDAMSRDPRVAAPEQTIQEVAKVMAEIGAGFLAVTDNGRLAGVISDRDIAVRAIALGRGANTLVRDAMSRDVKYCYDDEDMDQVTYIMAKQRVRRVPVVNRHKRLVGILLLGDLSGWQRAGAVAHSLGGMTRLSALHSEPANPALAPA